MKPTIVLVHGAFAESASWDGVIEPLLKADHPVIAAANPLRDLATDAASIADLIHTVDGPVVLVGHSYGGAVIEAVRATRREECDGKGGQRRKDKRPDPLVRGACSGKEPRSWRSHGRRATADDDPVDLCASVRRARRHRNALGRGRDQARTGGRTRIVYPFCTRERLAGDRAGGKTPANPTKPTPGLEPGTPSLRGSGRCHHQSPGVTSGHSLPQTRWTGDDSR
jgi:pimeloyl-ACP methyl ester carboxylesterase